MAIKVYGSPVSTCTGRVVACIEELDLEYELVPVDLTTGEHKRAPYIDRNPFGQIPALEDGHVLLFESRAITRYLARQYGKEKGDHLLKEHSPAEAAVVDQWIEVEAQHFNGPVSTIVFQCLFLPVFYGGKTDEAVVAAEVEKLGKVLDVYESRLSKTKYLAGERYSLADLHHITYAQLLINSTKHGSLILSRPHVKAWWDDISSRPASKKVLAALSFSA